MTRILRAAPLQKMTTMYSTLLGRTFRRRRSRRPARRPRSSPASITSWAMQISTGCRSGPVGGVPSQLGWPSLSSFPSFFRFIPSSRAICTCAHATGRTGAARRSTAANSQVSVFDSSSPLRWASVQLSAMRDVVIFALRCVGQRPPTAPKAGVGSPVRQEACDHEHKSAAAVSAPTAPHAPSCCASGGLRRWCISFPALKNGADFCLTTATAPVAGLRPA
jgi:hypothetical protein